MYVYICVHTTPRHILHNNWTLAGMVTSINAIFLENTEQSTTQYHKGIQHISTRKSVPDTKELFSFPVVLEEG